MLCMEDMQIIELYFARNQDAVKETEKEYGMYCFRIADNILHNQQDAEECVSDTWLRAWHSIPPNRPARLKLFLGKITRNLAFDKYRQETADKDEREVLEEETGRTGGGEHGHRHEEDLHLAEPVRQVSDPEAGDGHR